MEPEGEFRTEAGLLVNRSYGPDDLSADAADRIGEPGAFPFTRGNHAGGYRDRLWTFRQYSGFGTPEWSNERYKLLLKEGGTGLSVAADLPTQIGYDSDDPDVEEEVGRVGVALDSLADAEILFRDIPLDQVSTSWTVNGTAAIMLAFYVAVGKKQGVPRAQLRGTVQNDILKEYVARGTWIWPPEPSIRLIADSIEFCAAEVPRYNAVSVAGAHFRDAGANAAQEMAFTLQDAVTYCDEIVRRGRMTIDEFAPQISFFFYTHNDFFEEVAKYRAGRRRWAHIVRERYGAEKASSSMFRTGTVCGGWTLQAQQPQNNIVRVAYQAMAAVLGGVQSMFTAAWDEPFALPTEESTMLALRTQQILAHETGVTRTVDPLGGSYFVESLTDAMEARVVEIMADLEAHGGMVQCIEDGYVQRLIADESASVQHKIESGGRVIVGTNRYESDAPAPELEPPEMDLGARKLQLERLAEVRRTRNTRAAFAALGELRSAAQGSANLMPHLIDCVEEYCTVGEITSELKEVWGEYQQPAVF
jgi:methylmalonyl-CoA mutase N-terminal domain/subunit